MVFDRDYSWIPHFNLMQEKVTKVQHKLSRLATATWGLGRVDRIAVYSVVA